MSFADLKRSSSKSFDKINQELSKLNQKSSYGKDDGRYWKPTVDKVGNGYAEIRFLPPKEGEDLPWVMIWDHGFQGPNGLWYIENSLTTLGQDDPVSEYNSKLWNSTSDDDGPERKQARQQKRRLSYYSNIYVVKDASNPENEGKVFIYKYGKKIFDKIKDVMHPEFEDEEAMNPFDFWSGASFKLKIRQVEGYRNYDKSEFDSPSPLLADDADLEGVYEQLHSLSDIVDPKNFKSYTDLKTKMLKVLDEEPEEAPLQERAKQASWTEPKESATLAKPAAEKPATEDASGDDDLEFFKNFAE